VMPAGPRIKPRVVNAIGQPGPSLALRSDLAARIPNHSTHICNKSRIGSKLIQFGLFAEDLPSDGRLIRNAAELLDLVSGQEGNSPQFVGRLFLQWLASRGG